MTREISVEPEVSYPPQPEIDSEPGSAGFEHDSPEDFPGALPSANCAEGGNVSEVGLEGEGFPVPELEFDVSGAASFPGSGKGAGFKKPQGVRGRDRRSDSALLRHITHCSICNHPEREAIEQSILHWYSPTVIAYEFDLADRRIVYRHAHALGLFHRRMEQSRHALGFLIEQAQSIVPSADAIIRAVRALACIDDRGHWHEPRKEIVITHRYEDATTQSVGQEHMDVPDAGEQQPKRLAAASGFEP